MGLNKFINYKNACKILEDICKNKTQYYIIHYSCESFYNIKDGRTPRITSIAIRSLNSNQTDSFSIHKIAEKQNIDFKTIKDKYNELEFEMLSEYFSFIYNHKDIKWIHWNMRDINYGFSAIEHRYSVLKNKLNKNGPEIYSISNNNKIDMADLFIKKYGTGYANHPRLNNIIKLNKIKPKDFLSGKEEAEAFENQEYIKLHQSTLRKIDIISHLIEKAADNDLKTLSKFKDIYGGFAQGIWQMTKEKWQYALLLWVLSNIISYTIGKIF